MTDERPSLLLVDDDALITDTMAYVLSAHYRVFTAANRPEALHWMQQAQSVPALAVVDLGLPPHPHEPSEGFALIQDLLAGWPQLRVLVLSGQNEAVHARHARALGAWTFVAKPCEPPKLLQLLRQAQTAATPGFAPGLAPADWGLLGQSPAIARVRHQIRQLGPLPLPVLVLGESGTGKERVAQALHQARQPGQAWLALNCAALSPQLVEAQLFGHSKGAFTGASQARAGFFEEVGEGTLFLDEIGEMPLDMQAKLLRVLENGEYQRVGETTVRHSRARIVAATNRDLAQEVKQGRFRADLFHRLSVLTLALPPTRDLGADKHLLREAMLQQFSLELHLPAFSLSEEAQRLWLDYPFPGNVRELRNVVLRLLALYPGQNIDLARLQAEFSPLEAWAQVAPAPLVPTAAALPVAALPLEPGFELDRALAAWEDRYIEAALAQAQGNMSQAARLLGLSRSTLYSRLEARVRRQAHLTAPNADLQDLEGNGTP